jgi:hypothetical protein
VIERQAIRHAPAPVVADDREALEAEPGHQGDELGGALAVAVALAPRPAGCRAALSIALQVADDDRVTAGEARGDQVPTEVGLRKAVQQQNGRPVAGDPWRVAGRPHLDRRVLESLDHGFRLGAGRQITRPAKSQSGGMF